MAATPKRASHVEQALKDQPLSAATFERAAAAVAEDFQPIDDWRGSAAYRLHRRRQPAAPALLAHRRAAARGRGRGAMSGQVHTARRHDSALKHVTGQALYIDDMPEPPGTLHGALVLSPVASGRLRRLDLSPAAAAPGVVAVFAAGDIPGPQQHRRRRQGRAAVRRGPGRVRRPAAGAWSWPTRSMPRAPPPSAR